MNLPYDQHAEDTVITAMFCDENSAIEALAALEEEHFWNSWNRDLFRACAQLFGDSRKIVLPNVAERLQVYGREVTIQHREHIAELIGGFVPKHEFEGAVARLYAKHAHRQFLQSYRAAIKDIESEPANADAAIEQLQAKLLELQLPKQSKKLVQIGEMLPDLLLRIEQLKKGEIEPGIPTGFADIDDLVLMCPGDLTIVAARPSIGKTALCLAFAAKQAEAGNPVAIFSMEMNKESLGVRLLAMRSGVSGMDIRSGRITDQDFSAIQSAGSQLERLGIFIDDSPYTSVVDIQNKVRKLKLQRGVKTVYLDYLQLLTKKGGKSESRNQDVSEFSRGLKLMAGSCDVSVIALSQLSRACEARQDKRPTLSDLRDSGAIEQDADNVLFLYRDDYYYPDSTARGEAEVIIRKNRNGQTGTATLLFHNGGFLPKGRY